MTYKWLTKNKNYSEGYSLVFTAATDVFICCSNLVYNPQSLYNHLLQIDLSCIEAIRRLEFVNNMQILFSNTDDMIPTKQAPIQWRHNEPHGVSNQQSHDCLLNRYSEVDQQKYQNSASLAVVRRIHRWPHKGPVTWKMFPFSITTECILYGICYIFP